jgi:multimeric flavodoxin WrbA
MSNVLIVNGSLNGSEGNTAELLALAEERLSSEATVSYLELCRDPAMDRILDAAAEADAFLFGTGTYWDSWGSPLQRFLEMTAHTEAESYWVGKPVGAIVTAHAVGAKGVLSRLFGVLNVYGMLVPPMAGFAYTFVNQVALDHANEHLRNELWTVEDVEVVCHNLMEAVRGGRNWKQWPSNSGRYGEKWLTAYSATH